MKPPIERSRAAYLLAILHQVAEAAAAAEGRVGPTELRDFVGDAEAALVAHAVEHDLRGQKIENYAEAYNKRIIGVPRRVFYTAVLDAMRGHPDALGQILDAAPQYAGKWTGALAQERGRVVASLLRTGAQVAWRQVRHRDEVAVTLARYAAGSVDEQRSVSWGRYFAYDPETQTVAPAKFAGIFDMTFERYGDRSETDQPAFNGGATQNALRGLCSGINAVAGVDALAAHAVALGKALPDSPEVFVFGPQPRHHCLLGNPSVYDTLAAAQALEDDVWGLKAGDAQPGDKIAFWQTKNGDGNRGIVAFAEVTGSAADRPCPEASQPYWGPGQAVMGVARRLAYRYLEAPGLPLWLGGEHADLLASLSVSKAQGNKLYKMTTDQWAALLAAAGVGGEVLEGPQGPPAYTLEDALAELFLDRETVERILASLRRKKNIILQGPPGVGKSFMARRLAAVLAGTKDPDRVEMVQFHQSYAYEDFIQGFRPNAQGTFQLRDGVFYSFCRRAEQDPDRPYVFVIDEINRGNLSKIFGELMLLIEADKRGPDFSMPLTYAQASDDRFFVPENVFVIGLMNTADRSLAMVDYALRRRFVFHDILPAFHTPGFAAHLDACGVAPALRDRIKKRLDALNSSISQDHKNLGPGFAIGHSYFCPLGPGTHDEAWYRDIVETEISPLLDEYWFDDLETASQHAADLLKP